MTSTEETTVSGENNQTIKELTEYRVEYSKFYQMPDHSIQACVYAEQCIFSDMICMFTVLGCVSVFRNERRKKC